MSVQVNNAGRITIELDDKAFTKALHQLIKEVNDDKATRAIFRKGAKIYTEAAQSIIMANNDAPQVVKRYSTPKITGRLRAPNGLGHVVAEYHRGNLARSIKALPLRRAKNSIIVGPKASRKPKGIFASKSRVDGWYAHMVEYGTKRSEADPFAEPAWKRTKAQVQATILSLMKKKVESV